MTPINSTDEYINVPAYESCYPNWMNAECNNYSLDVSAEGIYNPAYEPYSVPSTDGPSSYLTPETVDVGFGSRNGSVSTIYTSTDSSVTESTYLGADTDARLVPDLVPSSEPKKRGLDSSERPPKRNCSETVGSTGPATSRPATRSKENRPPAAAPRSAKPKAGDRSETGKKSSDRARPSSSSTTTVTAATTTSSRGGTTHKAPQLRTASRRPKTISKDSGSSPTGPGDQDKDAEEDDLLTPDERRARHSHNLVEKQYRNRLNQQFESLLAVLPPVDGGNRTFSGGGGGSGGNGKSGRPRDGKGAGSVIDGGGGGGGGGGDDRRLSKAEVLDMARQRIVSLERECDQLRSERINFTANMGAVRDAVARGGIAGAAVAA